MHETIEAILFTVINHNIDLHGIDLNEFRDLLVLCPIDGQFHFNGNFYRQIDRFVKGSCLDPNFADIFISFKASPFILKSSTLLFVMLMIVLFY